MAVADWMEFQSSRTTLILGMGVATTEAWEGEELSHTTAAERCNGGLRHFHQLRPVLVSLPVPTAAMLTVPIPFTVFHALPFTASYRFYRWLPFVTVCHRVCSRLRQED